jgi:HTH-type transcriptional regulator / antitoxin HigA
MKSQVQIKPIRNNDDLTRALLHMDELFGARPGTEEGDLLEVLMVLVHEYESRHHPIPAPTPIDALRFRMDQSGLQPKDLIPFIGSKSRVSEVLSGKRKLSLPMIKRLSSGLRIPLESLVG